MINRNENAVSPVVGVMLMLVVTIIIAAVVSAFAGGMSGSQKSVPQMILKGYYSQSDGMRLEHNGGDVLSTQDLNVIVRHTTNMGSSHETWMSVVNKSIITNSAGKVWVNPTYAGVEVPRWAPGESMFISAANCQAQYLEPEIYAYHLANPMIGVLNWAAISSPSQVGSTFIVEITSKDGKLIAQVEVPITS